MGIEDQPETGAASSSFFSEASPSPSPSKTKDLTAGTTKASCSEVSPLPIRCNKNERTGETTIESRLPKGYAIDCTMNCALVQEDTFGEDNPRVVAAWRRMLGHAAPERFPMPNPSRFRKYTIRTETQPKSCTGFYAAFTSNIDGETWYAYVVVDPAAFPVRDWTNYPTSHLKAAVLLKEKLVQERFMRGVHTSIEPQVFHWGVGFSQDENGFKISSCANTEVSHNQTTPKKLSPMQEESFKQVMLTVFNWP